VPIMRSPDGLPSIRATWRLPLKRCHAIHDVLRDSSDAQRSDACTVLTPLCRYNRGLVVLEPAGVALDSPQAMEGLNAASPHGTDPVKPDASAMFSAGDQ
jgi:hypothetical protein